MIHNGTVSNYKINRQYSLTQSKLSRVSRHGSKGNMSLKHVSKGDMFLKREDQPAIRDVKNNFTKCHGSE